PIPWLLRLPVQILPAVFFAFASRVLSAFSPIPEVPVRVSHFQQAFPLIPQALFLPEGNRQALSVLPLFQPFLLLTPVPAHALLLQAASKPGTNSTGPIKQPARSKPAAISEETSGSALF